MENNKNRKKVKTHKHSKLMARFKSRSNIRNKWRHTPQCTIEVDRETADVARFVEMWSNYKRTS